MQIESQFTISALADAFRLHPTTLRKWLNDPYRRLRVDADASDRGARHRRFTVEDAVRVRVLSKLVNDLGIETGRAVDVVNQLHDLVAERVPTFIAEAAAAGKLEIEPAVWVLFHRLDTPEHHWIYDGTEAFNAAVSNRLLSGRIAFELRAETLAAVVALRQSDDTIDAEDGK